MNKTTSNPKVPHKNMVAIRLLDRRSKRFIGRGTRRSKDARRSWRNEEH